MHAGSQTKPTQSHTFSHKERRTSLITPVTRKHHRVESICQPPRCPPSLTSFVRRRGRGRGGERGGERAREERGERRTIQHKPSVCREEIITDASCAPVMAAVAGRGDGGESFPYRRRRWNLHTRLTRRFVLSVRAPHAAYHLDGSQIAWTPFSPITLV